MSYSVSASILLDYDEIGELGATLGIDIQAVRGAPLREFVRIDNHPLDDVSLTAEMAFAVLGGLEPFIKGVVEPVSVFEDGVAEPVIVFATKPSHADGANLSHFS